MQTSEVREDLLQRTLSLDEDQFEQFCKMLIQRAERTRDLELTPFRGDGSIDVHAVIDRDLFHARLGVQAKRYAPGNTVGPRTIRSFKGALGDQNYHIGTVITTSSFTSGAVESAERDYIRMIDGEKLVDIMLDSEIGAIESSAGVYEIDEEFWVTFETPVDSNTIPSLEVPQADDFKILRHVIRGIDKGEDIKPEITKYLEFETGKDWASRQADYYGIAGWLLGFLHKEKRVQIDGHKVRRWGLTREGEEYLELLDRGDEDRATERLHEAIRDVEIVSRVYDVLEDEGILERHEIADIIEEETDVSGSTTGRRARTIGQWLVELSEIHTRGKGPTQEYEYRSASLDDFS